MRLSAVIFCLTATTAFAQGGVVQSGAITAYHPAAWFSSGVVGDGGAPGSPALGAAALFNGSACPLSVSSQTGPGTWTTAYSQFSFCQTDTTSTFYFQGFGQANPAVVFNIDGVNYSFPGSGNGDVAGPASAVDGNFACFNSASGKLLKDCGTGPVSPSFTGGANFATSVDANTLHLNGATGQVSIGYGDFGCCDKAFVDFFDSGNNSTSDGHSALEAQNHFAPTADGAYNPNGLYGILRYEAAGNFTGAGAGVRGNAYTIDGYGSENVTFLPGLYGRCRQEAAGTVTWCLSILADGAQQGASHGAMTNSANVYMIPSTLGTHNYGLYQTAEPADGTIGSAADTPISLKATGTGIVKLVSANGTFTQEANGTADLNTGAVDSLFMQVRNSVNGGTTGFEASNGNSNVYYLNRGGHASITFGGSTEFDLDSSGNAQILGSMQVAATGNIYGTGRTVLKFPSDGVLRAANNAQTNSVDFTIGASNLLTINGGLTTGNVGVRTPAVAVSSLASCAAGTQGLHSFVTDANATLTAGIGGVVANGGANVVPVVCDGTNWRIGANDNHALDMEMYG